MKIQAEYQMTNFKSHVHYQCNISHAVHPEFKNVKLQGQHIAGKNRQDVIALKFINCLFTKLPQKFSKLFPNLKILLIWNSGMMELTKADLAEYKALEIIYIQSNMLSILPGDIFEGFKHIKSIYITGNKLKTIEPSILDGLFSLELAHFELGDEDDEIYVKGQRSYKEFRDGLRTRFCSGDDAVANYIKKLEQNVIKFKKMKENLSVKVHELDAANDDLTGTNDYLRQNNILYLEMINCLVKDKKENEKTFQERIENVHKNYKKGIYGDFNEYIKDETTKDFKIIIGLQEFKVHKVLLAARIPTLAEIIKNNPDIKSLNLVGIKSESFEAIMRFLYTDELIGEEAVNFLDLLSAAGKLKIKDVINQAAAMVTIQLTQKNALEGFKLGSKYKEPELMERAC